MWKLFDIVSSYEFYCQGDEMMAHELVRKAAVSLVVTLLMTGLAACGAAQRPGPEPLVWKSRQIAFVVDREGAVLRMLSVRSGVSPLKLVPLGHVTGEPAMLLDEPRGLLWVRSDDRLMRFDVPSLQPAGTWDLPEGAQGATIEVSRNGAISLRAEGKFFVIDRQVVAQASRVPTS